MRAQAAGYGCPATRPSLACAQGSGSPPLPSTQARFGSRGRIRDPSPAVRASCLPPTCFAQVALGSARGIPGLGPGRPRAYPGGTPPGSVRRSPGHAPGTAGFGGPASRPPASPRLPWGLPVVSQGWVPVAHVPTQGAPPLARSVGPRGTPLERLDSVVQPPPTCIAQVGKFSKKLPPLCSARGPPGLGPGRPRAYPGGTPPGSVRRFPGLAPGVLDTVVPAARSGFPGSENF